MDFDLVAKLAAVIGGAVATWKVIVELLRGRPGYLREEYRFARDFINELDDNPRMHPFLREKGYQAIAGDTRLSSSEIAYLLTLHDSARSLKDYVIGLPYLQHLATSTSSQIVFRSKYVSTWSRRVRKFLYFMLYMAFYLSGFAPLFLPAFKALPAAQALVAFAFTAAVCFPAGFLALYAGVRIARAEVLVKNQQKHSQGILVAERELQTFRTKQ